jgi:hypothetical protein
MVIILLTVSEYYIQLKLKCYNFIYKTDLEYITVNRNDKNMSKMDITYM